MKAVFLFACFAGAAASIAALQLGLSRNLLWATIQVCVWDHELLNRPAPCLAVDSKRDRGTTYVILRNPADKSHFVVAPTRRIVGIEAPELRQPEAAHYLQEAWANRRLAYPDGATIPDRDMGIAINSQRGRTQDQFHIHVDCALPTVESRIAALSQDLQSEQWTPVRLADPVPYWATAIPGDSLDAINVVDRAASFLHLSRQQMPLLTLAVFAVRDDTGRPKFILVARRDLFRQHAELLLDHDCMDHRRTESGQAADLH